MIINDRPFTDVLLDTWIFPARKPPFSPPIFSHRSLQMFSRGHAQGFGPLLVTRSSMIFAHGSRSLPSGYFKIAMENGPVEIVDLSLKMMIFHSYNSLPEGKYPTAIMVNLNCHVFSIRIAIRVILKLSYQKSTFVRPTTSLVGIYSYYRFISQRFHASLHRSWLVSPTFVLFKIHQLRPNRR